ncbi:isoprenyl transferase [Candidatus Sumerlaeota bacterium]|nr:isoprenyl transferase [Candidatus Sumerlaeota bacterium]
MTVRNRLPPVPHPIAESRAWPPSATENWEEADRGLLDQLGPEDLPHHIAVIMDGNGRWARARGLIDRIRGHEAGIESVRETTRTCAALGIEALTLYSFSKENWQRPAREVAALMRLLERFAVQERDELMDNGVRLKTIGNLEDLPESVQSALAETMRLTENNTGTTLVLALSYGGRDEIIRAVRRLGRRIALGELDPGDIDEDSFSALLDTAEFPAPDLLIRTSGEFRLSNFLLWQIAYAELYVTPVLWPDFRRPHLLEALIDFKKRDRRFGRVNAEKPKRRSGAAGKSRPGGARA